MKYKLAVFDVDGTLLDTRAGILSSVRFTIEQFGKKMPPERNCLNLLVRPFRILSLSNLDLIIIVRRLWPTCFENGIAKKIFLKPSHMTVLWIFLPNSKNTELNLQ